MFILWMDMVTMTICHNTREGRVGRLLCFFCPTPPVGFQTENAAVVPLQAKVALFTRLNRLEKW